MKTKMSRLFGPFVGAYVALSVLCFACASCMTPGQTQVQVQIGTGEAIGSYLLKKNATVAYIAQYESEIPNVAGLMQGKITPADLHNILSAETTAGLSAQQISVIGLLNGATQEWIKVNQGTPEGALVDAAAKNVALGMGNAVGLVTGTNYVPTVGP